MDVDGPIRLRSISTVQSIIPTARLEIFGSMYYIGDTANNRRISAYKTTATKAWMSAVDFLNSGGK